jgi:archaellum biogenesis ATPase FlaH|tara:strand:+ start:5377 stop:6600 length:1224 start_codon:yes stop_codon:yes gene_type:complete
VESYGFIESGIIFGIDSLSTLKNLKYTAKDFSVHSESMDFLLDYYDSYTEFPTQGLLLEKFPDLDASAVNASLDYCTDAFRKQVIYRNVVDVINTHKGRLTDDPESVIGSYLEGLEKITLQHDDDLFLYDNGTVDRLDDYKHKQTQRASKFGIIGIPTPFKTINNSGVGMQPGEVYSVFARPSVGKTWMCCRFATTAAMCGYKTLFVSAEMPVKEIMMRLDVLTANALKYNFTHDSLRTGQGLDEAKYQEFLAKINQENMFVCDSIDQSTVSIAGISSLVRKYKPDLIVLDNIDLVGVNASGNQALWEKMHSLFYGMKNICTVNKCACIISTQANKGGFDVFSPPQAHHVAFGDALIRASDVAFSMFCVEDNIGKRMLQFQKFRNSSLANDKVTLDWNVNIGLIKEE